MKVILSRDLIWKHPQTVSLFHIFLCIFLRHEREIFNSCQKIAYWSKKFGDFRKKKRILDYTEKDSFFFNREIWGKVTFFWVFRFFEIIMRKFQGRAQFFVDCTFVNRTFEVSPNPISAPSSIETRLEIISHTVSLSNFN